MSRKYKFHNPTAAYFVSFATVYWIDIFTSKTILIFQQKVQTVAEKKKVWSYLLSFVGTRCKRALAGVLPNPIDWKYSSAINYADDETILKIDNEGMNLGIM